MPDLITATHNDASSTANLVYNTGATPSGKPSWTFTAASSTHFQPNSNLPVTGSITYYAVYKPTSHCATTACPFFGGGQFGNNYPEYGIGVKQYFNSAGVVNIGNSTTSPTVGVWHTGALTYNFTSGAWTFWICTGGTCTADGSGTTTGTFSYPNSAYLGGWFPGGEWFDGQIAEWGIRTTADVSGIGAWSFCWFGV
jgi:hypothetical protein